MNGSSGSYSGSRSVSGTESFGWLVGLAAGTEGLV